MHAERRKAAPPLRHDGDALACDHVGGLACEFLRAQADRSSRRPDQAHDGLTQRRLAHAVAAHQGQGLDSQRQVHALEDVRPTVVDVDVANLEHGLVHVVRPLCGRGRSH